MFFFLQAEDGIRGLVRSRGLGDVYKRQVRDRAHGGAGIVVALFLLNGDHRRQAAHVVDPGPVSYTHLTLPTIYPV